MPTFLYAFGLALIAPILALLVAVIFGVKAGIRSRGFRVAAAAVPVTLALNPAVQPLFLERLDARQSQALRARVETSRLVGQPEAAVTAVLGPPDRVRKETPQVFTLEGQLHWQGKTQTVWEYQAVPYYWNASTVQVVFEDGVVARLSSARRSG